MGIAQDLWGITKQAIATAAMEQLARQAVATWVNFRPERARVEMRRAVTTSIAQGNVAALTLILKAFGEQIQLADTQDFQNEINQLLWDFKAAVNVEIVAHPELFNPE